MSVVINGDHQICEMTPFDDSISSLERTSLSLSMSTELINADANECINDDISFVSNDKCDGHPCYSCYSCNSCHSSRDYSCVVECQVEISVFNSLMIMEVLFESLPQLIVNSVNTVLIGDGFFVCISYFNFCQTYFTLILRVSIRDA